MRFLLKGYAAAAVLELTIWLYGIDQEPLNAILRIWLGGGALGLWLAWRWFLQNQTHEAERTHEAPMERHIGWKGRGLTVARDMKHR